jgi:hypothetical protein
MRKTTHQRYAAVMYATWASWPMRLSRDSANAQATIIGRDETRTMRVALWYWTPTISYAPAPKLWPQSVFIADAMPLRMLLPVQAKGP